MFTLDFFKRFLNIFTQTGKYNDFFKMNMFNNNFNTPGCLIIITLMYFLRIFLYILQTKRK